MDESVTMDGPAGGAGEAAGGRVTPVMEQFIEIKAANPDCLLFFRMGDFYELFFDDAEVASRTLGIALTKRGKHLGEDIPMCGVPVHAADDYLQRLIAAGHRVAVCEQLEDPAEARKRGSKSVVKRGVTRLVTPGTITEDNLLDARRASYLAALSRMRGEAGGDRFALAWIDISTGSFRVAEEGRVGLGALIARIEPRELLVPDALLADDELKTLLRESSAAIVPLPKSAFEGATAEGRIARYYGVQSLDAFGSFSRAEVAAAAAVVGYVEKTQVGARPPLDPPKRETAAGVMAVDAATRANLELTRTLSGARQGSLLDAIDRTVTGAGARLLAERLASPLTAVAEIRHRHDAIEALLEEPGLRDRLRRVLMALPEMARPLSRLALGRGGPRDLGAIAAGLAGAADLYRRLGGLPLKGAEVEAIRAALGSAPVALVGLLGEALADELPLLKRDGGFLRPGADEGLDEARALRDASRQVIAGLQQRYAERAGVKALKVRHNNVLGYYVEVPQAQATALMQPPLNADFFHRQTMAGAMRFSTAELGELESRISGAADKALAIELEAFEGLVGAVLAEAGRIKQAAEAVARLDVAIGLAVLAEETAAVRPVVDDSLDFRVIGGRHPVVEQVLMAEGTAFVPNDCDLSAPEGAVGGRLWLVTGPNMAGKSTFLRQNALIALMAQIGAYVPAKEARIGVVDRLFSRVGAADDLARGRSTFMVEMIETAAILNQAGPRALVILDEIGRGTATFDGLSIAWAAVEHLHEENRSRALFATHYHELTALADTLPRVQNATVRVKEWRGDVVFLHEIVPGAADRSYGVQVAKLAGLPAPVVKRARAVLAELEKGGSTPRLVDDLPLFTLARRREVIEEAPEDAALTLLDGIDPDELTPRAALDALYRLKAERRKRE
jgi:DNA mismatch repair protein MutS